MREATQEIVGPGCMPLENQRPKKNQGPEALRRKTIARADLKQQVFFKCDVIDARVQLDFSIYVP